VKREEDRKELFFFWHRAKVRDLTNPTVCSYRPAEILREKTPFRPPHRPGPNVKEKENREKKLKGKTR
jgi:hypothetical protein